MSKRAIAGIAVAVTLGVLLGGIAGAGAWIFHTESGLRWLSTRAMGFAGEGLELEGVAGTLSGGARVQHIRFTGEDIELQVRDAALVVSPLSVLRLRPRLSALSATELSVKTKPSEPRGAPPDTLALPLDFELRNAYLGKLILDLGEGPQELTNVRLDYEGGKSTHRVNDLSLSVMGLAVALRGTIDAQPPFALQGSFAAVRPQDGGATVYGTATGTLSALALDAAARAGEARVTATATIHPYDAVPLVKAQAQIAALDLKAWMADLPQTRIAGRVDLVRAGDSLTGPIALTNSIPGPYDKGRLPLAALRAQAQSDFKRATFTSLLADLGAAGVITGSGKLNAGAAQLTLSTKNLNLAALYSSLRPTQLAGRADIALDETQQRVNADLTERDIALSVTAVRTGEIIELPKFEARARGGVARGSGRLSTAQPQPFSLDASFARFDPAAWGAFPRGSINGELTAQGTVAGPAAELAFAIRESRWLDAPLAANGKLSATAERVRNADLEVTLGGNRITAQGALGQPNDTLAVRINAPRLALFDPALSGTLKASGQVSGSFKAPRIRFEADGSGLKHQEYGAIRTLEARGALGTQANAPADITVLARGISTPQLDLDSVSLRLEGTREAHAALAQARGDRIDLVARVRGGWNEGRGWNGTVQELANRGEVTLQLAAPVTVAVGPGRVRVSPLNLRAMGGELAISELVYEQGRLATAGRFSNLPVKPLVALAGAPADMAGTLRLAGQWSIRTTPQLTGSIAIARESGDVTLGPKSPLRVGLETLALDAQLGERGIQFTARVRSALATASAQGLVRPVGSGAAAQYSAASPLEFTAEADVAQMAPFAAFIDTPILLRGQAQARLRGTGTVGDPHVTGPVTASELAVALPAEGVELTGGTLRAQLTEREIRVESFSIRGGDGVFKAQGTLARVGFDQASVDWQAERFRVLARPDRRLVVSGKGNAGLKSGKLSFTGNLRANEGLFDIGGTTLPTLGSDVVIVGPRSAQKVQTQAETAPPTKTVKGFALDLNVDLGNQVEVRGQGLQVWLGGELRVYTSAAGAILAKGTVNARNGLFEAYGQRLVIDRGNFYFDGPIANPGIDIVAMRKRQAVEAGVAISGTLRNPVVRVVSNPSVPQSEALSWLILGRAPDQASSGQLSALPLATNALLGKATGSLAKRLRVDELGLSGSGGLGDQFVTVGKRITDRLYLYFEQGLGTAESLLRLEFTLTERVVLRAQGGTTSALGVFYRLRWD